VWAHHTGNEPTFAIGFADALDMHERKWVTYTAGKIRLAVHHAAIVYTSRSGVTKEWEFDGRFGKSADITRQILAGYRDYQNRLNFRFHYDSPHAVPPAR
jgi:hypothetical protein